MKENRKVILQIIMAVLLPLIFLAILRCSTLSSGEPCVDAYYHIALADTGPSFFMGRVFPHMTMSTWENNFSDKELVYHLILSGLRSWSGFLGFSTEAPFNFPTLFFACILLCAFVYTVFKFQIKHIWLYSLLLVCISPGFTSRILMLRPHLLGITLFIMAAYLSSKVKKVNEAYSLFILGFIAAWSYSNPHFILVPILAFAFFTFTGSKKLALAMPSIATVGIFAGLLIHPQFPNTFLSLEICINILFETLKTDKFIYTGDELKSISLSWIKENIIFILLFSFNILSFSLILTKNKLKNIPVPLKSVFLISLITCAGTILSARTIEYACPFTIITTGLIITEMQVHNDAYAFRKKAIYLIALMILSGLIYTSILYFNAFRNRTFNVPVKFAKWIEKSNIPAGTVIANLCWSDFPALYYALPQYRYLVGLDPMFAYKKNPEAIKKLESFRTGGSRMSPAELAALTKARFAYVSVHGWQLARDMHKAGYRLIYQDEESYFFILNETEKQP